MPKGLDIDKIVAEALRRLGQSGVADDAARIGGNMVDKFPKRCQKQQVKLQNLRT
jgi:mannitol-1-phosphate/altronate dehydrogenase